MSNEHPSRRFFLRSSAAAAGLALLAPFPEALLARARQERPLRIGLIGSGRMGGAVGLALAKAGHEVFFSSRHPEELRGLVEQAGGRSRAGLPQEAAEFGEVVIIAVPYGALPQVGRDYAALMRDKIVIDLGNPRADRDGPMADDAIARGTGVASAGYLPGVRLVRAFSTLSFRMVEEQAHREGELIGVPSAGDDPAAVETVVGLVEDAGFEPVVVGPLSRAREFDRGTEVYVTGMTAAEIRAALGIG